MQDTYSIRPRDFILAIAGPAAVGAVLGLQFNAFFMVREAATVPAITCGVTVAMVPALYIAMSLFGGSSSPSALFASVVRALGTCGVVMLGLAAPVGFLLATTDSAAVVRHVGAVVVGSAACAGLRVVWVDLFCQLPDDGRWTVLFASWSAVSFGIGAKLFLNTI